MPHFCLYFAACDSILLSSSCEISSHLGSLGLKLLLTYLQTTALLSCSPSSHCSTSGLQSQWLLHSARPMCQGDETYSSRLRLRAIAPSRALVEQSCINGALLASNVRQENTSGWLQCSKYWVLWTPTEFHSWKNPADTLISPARYIDMCYTELQTLRHTRHARPFKTCTTIRRASLVN